MAADLTNHGNNAMTENDMLTPDVPLDSIRLDGGTQSRAAMDEAAITEYAEALKQGATLPPLVTFFDGVDFWLADGFHRYHAYRAAGVERVTAEVRTGSRRDAVLFSVGANAAHGLRRTNEDKRRAVKTLLDDAEWATWSDNAIAKACAVAVSTVGAHRASLSKMDSETPGERTYTTKHGTTATMNTANIGKAKPAPVESPATEIEAGAPAAIAAEQTPAHGDTPQKPHIEEVLDDELAALRDEVIDLRTELANALADNEMMGRVFDAEDQVKAALEEARRQRALAENAERTLAAKSQEFIERARNVVYWKNRAEKAEKMLGKAA